MNKLDKLKKASAKASQQTSDELAAKIEALTLTQFDSLIESLRNTSVNDQDVARLIAAVDAATDKNKVIRDYIAQSESLAKAVGGVLTL